MEGPDEPVFSGFRDAEILVASNKGQVFSEFISSFDKQIDISKQGEKEKTKSNPSFGHGSSSRIKIFMFEDSLFRKLQHDWSSIEIDYNRLHTLNMQSMPDWLIEEAKSVLKWAEGELQKNTFKRGDYKEMCELLVQYLGGSVKNFKFKIPGADHHARWMSKVIYCLKLALLSDQYILEPDVMTKILECASFQSIIYCKYWFQCPIPVMAPLLDLQYYGKLLNWKQVSPIQAFELTKLLRKHLWYLTPELVTLSLFDQHVPAEVIIIFHISTMEKLKNNIY